MSPIIEYRVITSRCLLGDDVRYDGTNKKSQDIDVFYSRFFSLLPVCPEVEAGMGIPRAPIQLVQNGDDIAAVRVDGTATVTRQLGQHVRQMTTDLDGCDGAILKSRSPSCGFGTTPIFNSHGRQLDEPIDGLFTAALREANPHLPVADENLISTANGRLDFITRMDAYRQINNMLASHISVSAIGHTLKSYELLFMTYCDSNDHVNSLMNTVSRHEAEPGELHYEQLRQQCLAFMDRPATRNDHLRVINTILTLHGSSLPGTAKTLLESARDHIDNLAGLLGKLTSTLLQKQPDHPLLRQKYLQPAPAEVLALI